MPRTAKFEIVETPKGWQLNVPASASETGKRRRLYFETQEAAKNEATKRKRELRKYGQCALHIAPDLSVEAERCRSMLEPYGIRLTQAVSEWIERHEALIASESVENAFDAYVTHKEARGRTEMYLDSITKTKDKLPAWFLKKQVAAVERKDVAKVLKPYVASWDHYQPF